MRWIMTCMAAASAMFPPPIPPQSPPAEPASQGAGCRDRVEQVREWAGQPKLDRDLADPAEPLLIAAVDKQIGGCRVIQMMGNVNDLRLPPEPQVRARLLPAG